MTRLVERIKSTVFFNPWLKWIALPLATLAVVGTVMSQSAPAPLSTPQVGLSSTPLYAQGARAKPALMLALSVEFPTVGATYLSPTGAASDNSYSATTQYIGYFDSEGCYSYNDSPQEGAPATYARFDRTGNASSRTCGGTGFSGNFMNWASSSAIDILRYGLTGGDRVVDTTSLTILQRAVLPNTNVSSNFWNGTNFPDKQISAAAAASVLPIAMIGSYSGTIHIANCLNRIHFGSAATGSCASPAANSVFGVTSPSSSMGPVSSYTGSLPSNFTSCSTENGTCSFSGIKQVAFGAGTSWLFASASNGLTCSNAVFGSDPDQGTVKGCYIRTDTTGWSPSTAAGVLTTDDFFYTRVSVCGSDGSGNLTDPRPDLCQRYPSGQYKPIGNLQKYSDRLRVSAFGYLNDPTDNPNQRYGGVLRAPMKYVGPTYYDANFSLVSGTNPNEEWDPATGIFYANPDNNSTVSSGPSYSGPYLSGVTNYLNQFGRTGIFGQYKTFDPVGELYYESLRYLQGLAPTSQAFSTLSGQTLQTLQDGYPAFSSWTDPNPAVAGMTDYSCVRNNIFVVGDIHTHNDGSIPGNTTRTTNDFSRPSDVAGTPNPSPTNQPDFYYWMKVVGGFESGNPVTYLDGTGSSRSTTSPANPNPISSLWGLQDQVPVTANDGATYYMAGIAYWANTHDIRGTGWTAQPSLQRPGMRVTTYMLDVNEYGNSSSPAYHDLTQFYLAAKYGGFTDASQTGNPFKAKDGTVGNTDWQNSSSGDPNTYYLSSSAQAVLNGLNQIFASVAGQAGSIAGGAVSTQQLTTNPGVIYQAQFNPAGWSGELAAYAVTNTSGAVSVSTTAYWQASVELAAKAAATTPGGANRDIVIGNTNAAAATASDFNWTSSLPANVQTAMETPPYASSGTALDPASTGQARLNYLRGDRTNESPNGLLMRARTGLLGDIVNSGVAFSGAPSQNIADPAYATFLTTYANRKHALFVGANDGMLHAFDPDNPTVTGHAGGNELFGYIPSWMMPKLTALTSPNYVHQSYVDATPTVVEAKVGSTWASGVWKTVLVGGTGGGGPGVFALDVSDPAAFNASKVMWEFTANDDPELGEVIGVPQILKFRTTGTSASADYQYFAVVASGVNNYANSGFKPGTSSPATLFLLDLSKAVGTPWTLGTNYFKIEFGPAATATANGLVNFNATTGTDNGAVSAIYAGDLQGNMWKVAFTQATNGKSDWNLGKLSFYQNGSGPVPMFIARSATGAVQPITMQPTLAYGSNQSILVSFGTGKFLEASDNTIAGAPTQSVYALVDNGSNTLDSGTSSSSAIAGRGRLVAASVNTSTGVITVPSFNWGRPLTDGDMTQRSGWYIDFPNSGERQVSNFTLEQGNLYFGSLIPALNSCDVGSGYFYAVQILTGNGGTAQSNVGILGQPFVLQVGNWSANTTARDSTGRISQFANFQVVEQGSAGLSVPTTSIASGQWGQYAGRLSWREITNYQQLRHAP